MTRARPIVEPWLDALGQSHSFRDVPRRVVSLVPSETQSVIDLLASERLVGITDYCPAAGNAKRIGGTKNPNVDDVLALQPDLILCNKEENTEMVVRRLVREGLRVHVSFPQSLDDGIEYIHQLACLLGVPKPTCARRDTSSARRARVFVPIWREPWMTFNAHTYAHSVLEAAGFENVFARRIRRKTLAEDLAPQPFSDEVEAEGDTRYPRLSIEEIVRAKPDTILLPDEPYVFSQRDADELHEATGAKVLLISGRPLFWYGTMSEVAVAELRRATAELEFI